MNRPMLAAIVLAVATMAPAITQAQTVSGQIYVGTQPQQQPVYVQQQPVYQQPYQQPYQQQPRTEERAHVGLIVGGAVMFGVSWLVHGALISPFGGWSLDFGYDPQWESFRYAGLIPLAGPWIQMALKPGSLNDDGWGTYLIIDGLLQAGGLTMLILGATITETVTVYGDSRTGPSLSFGIAPGGLSASGTF